MVRLFVFLSVLYVSSTTFGQTIWLSGKVVDETGHPIEDVHFYFANQTARHQQTDEDGNYSVKFDLGTRDTLLFRHVGFNDYDLAISRRLERSATDGRLELNIVMPAKMGDPIIITSNMPDTVFGTQEYSVADFEFDRSGHIILLTYEKNLDKGSVLRVLDQDLKVADSYYVPEVAVELETDFRGNTHLITTEKVFLVRVENSRLAVFLEDRDYYFKYVAPLIDTIGNNLYFSNYSELYPAFDYVEFNTKDSSYKPLLTVQDDLMMELYRSEFKYVDVRTKIWAHNKQLETGIDKEIWVGATVFTNSVYYQPLYAPLFKVGEDTLVVFDHYKDLMFKYTPSHGFVDSTSIAYHKESRKSGWEQPLVQDRKKETVYGVFLRNGYTYLNEIDLKTGAVLKSFRLYYKYVERIRIIGGYVYYVYRPFESIQKKYIYREKLKG